MFRICVITVRNELQKQVALAELRRRSLPSDVEFSVLVDPIPDIGSGGSTIHVLQHLAGYGQVQNNSILIIHSGGRASRIEQFSTIGKLFIPLPSAEYPTVFDLIIHSFSNLPDSHVIVTSGDQAVLGLENVVFSSTGVTGIAAVTDGNTAAKHGVYHFTDAGNPHKVRYFTEKPTVIKYSGCLFWVDTGILHFAPDVVNELIEKDICRSNLYKDILPIFKDRLYCYADPAVSFYHLGTHDDFVNNFIKLKEVMNEEDRIGNTAISISG